MPVYSVVILFEKQRKTVAIMQSSSSDAEREAKNQFPGCEVLKIGRTGENTLRLTGHKKHKSNDY